MSFEEFPLNEDFQGYAATSKVGDSPVSPNDSVGKKRRRTKPCVNCRKRKTKCVKEGMDHRCLECIKRRLVCVSEDKSNEKTQACDNCQYRRRTCVPLNHSELCYDCLSDGLSCIHTGTKSITIDSSYQNIHKVLGISSDREVNLVSGLGSSSPMFYEKNNVLYEVTPDISAQTSASFIIEIQSIIDPVGPLLIKLFFKYFNSNIPLLSFQQQNILTNLKNNNNAQVNPLLLTMVYLNALKFAPLEPMVFPSLIDISKLENISIIFLKDLKDTSIEMIQGILLMLYYNYKTNTSYNEESLEFLHKCVDLVEINGFNYSLEPSMNEYKVVLWQVVKLDRFVSLLEFKPLRTRDWDISKLSTDDFADGDIADIYLNILQLSNDHALELIDSLYNYKSFNSDDLETIKKKSDEYSRSIDKWYHSLSNEIESTITVNLHYYLLVFLNYRRLINKIIENDSTTDLIPKKVSDSIIKNLSAFNDILLIPELRSILEYQILPSYLTKCFTNYYIVLKLLQKLNFNVTALIQSYELKSKQLSIIEELNSIDFSLLDIKIQISG